MGRASWRPDSGVGTGGHRTSALPADIQRFVAVLATGFVLFTLFINGTSLRVAIRLLGIDRLSLRDAALRDQIQALSYAEARDAAREIARVHVLSQAAVERVIAPYQARLDAAQAAQDATARNLSEADQLAIALVSLASQERVLIIEIVREGMVSPGVAQALLSNSEALAEAARSEGRSGYKSASDETTWSSYRVPRRAFSLPLVGIGANARRSPCRETRNSSDNAHCSRTPLYVQQSNRQIVRQVYRRHYNTRDC